MRATHSHWAAVVLLAVFGLAGLLVVDERPSGARATEGDAAATATEPTTPASSEGAEPGATSQGAPAGAAGTPPTTAAAGVASNGKAKGSPSSAPATTPTTQSFDHVGKNNTMPLTVTLARDCVTPGRPQTVNVVTRGWASVAAAATFSDGSPHGALTVGHADPQGTWSWTFVVSPKAPPGDARVILSVEDRSPGSNDAGAGSNGENAQGTYPFKVKDKC